jgi:hypothetical protein
MSWNDRHKILNGCNRAKEFAWHMSLGLRDRPQRTAERSVPPLNEDKTRYTHIHSIIPGRSNKRI